MKKLIFVIVIFTCGLSQCKKTEDVSSKISDENLFSTAEDADTSKNIVKGVVPSDTASSNPMKVIPEDSAASIFIRMFYEEYILGLENNSVDSVKRRYCTSELIEKLQIRS